MTVEPWLAIAILCSFAGYLLYGLGLHRSLLQPSRASWLIWSAATAMEAVTYAAVNPGAPQAWVFGLSACLCLIVTFSIWRRSAWELPSRTEAVCIGASLSALALWLIFRDAFWAHMLVVAAVPVSFWPTWQSVAEDRARERSPAWGLWSVGDMATLLVAVRATELGVAELGYIIVEFLCHASVWFMIGLATINPLRSLGWARGGLRVLDRYRPTANLFRVDENHLGQAVYASAPIKAGAILLEFTGRRFHAEEVPSVMLHGSSDHYVQVTRDQFLGPSGRLDDLINHSCDPNAGLSFTETGVFLIALRDIAPGEELSWDYSTTLLGSDWRMICQCRTEKCRRVIGNFDTLPVERQAWFRARGLVAPYLREQLVGDGRKVVGG